MHQCFLDFLAREFGKFFSIIRFDELFERVFDFLCWFLFIFCRHNLYVHRVNFFLFWWFRLFNLKLKTLKKLWSNVLTFLLLLAPFWLIFCPLFWTLVESLKAKKKHEMQQFITPFFVLSNEAFTCEFFHSSFMSWFWLWSDIFSIK